MGFLKTYKRVAEPGRERVYLSANTAVLGEVIERVTGRRLADVLSEEIWSRVGAEGDAQLVVNERGFPMAHGGLAMTLRDLARVGLLFTDAAKGKGTAVTSTMLPRLLGGGRELLKGPYPPWLTPAIYQFDVSNENGVLAKGGFAGQMLYIDTRLDVVVAYFATNVTLDEPFGRFPIRKLTTTHFEK